MIPARPDSWQKWFQSSLLLFFTAFALRVVFGLFFGTFADDVGEYTSYAINYLHGRGFVSYLGYPTPNTPYYAFLPPLYPVALIIYFKWISTHLAGLRVLFAAGGALTCVFTAWISEKLMRSPAGVLAGWVLCFLPSTIFWSTRLQSESLVMLFLTMTLWLLFRTTPSRPWETFTAGGLAALCTLGRSEFLVLPFLFLVWFLIRKNMAHRFRTSALLFLGFALVMSPWVIRNSRIFHRFTINTSGRGEAFYAGHNPDYRFGGVGPHLPPEVIEQLKGLDEMQIADRMTQLGLRYMRQHPGIAALTLVGNLLVMCRPFLTPGFVPWSQNLIYTFSTFPVLLFFLMGVQEIYTLEERDGWILLLLIVVAKILVALPFYTVLRFREVVSPLIVIIASFGFLAWRSPGTFSQLNRKGVS